MRRSAEHRKEQARPRGLLFRFSRLVFTLLILTAILYGTVLAAARTAGFHAIVERRLTDAYPLVWSVKETRITWRLALQIDELRAQTSADEVNEVFRADRVEIAPDWRTLVRLRLACGGVRIQRPVVVFHRTETGWSPVALAVWAQRMDPAEGLIPSPGGSAATSTRPASTEDQRARWPAYPVEASDGQFEWRSDRLETAMTATDVHLEIRPVRAGERTFVHGKLRADAWHGAMGILHRNYSVEWLALDHRRWIIAMD